MAEQRQPFRFRLPWLAQPQRARLSPDNPQPPSQTTTSVPIRRPSNKSQPPTIEPPKKPKSTSTPASAKIAPQSTSPTQASIANESLKPNSQSNSSPKTNAQSNSPSSKTAKTISPSKTKSPSTSSPSSPTTKAPPKSTSPSATANQSSPSKVGSQSTPSKPVIARTNSLSPTRPDNESLKITPQRALTKPTSESAKSSQREVSSVPSSPLKGGSQSKASSTPVTSSRANSQAQEESVKNVPLSPPHSAPQKEYITQASTPSQSISSLAKPQSQGGSESPTSTKPRPLLAQEEAEKSGPLAPLQESELKVEITSGTTETSIKKDDTVGLISKESTPLPKKLIEGESKGLINPPTQSFENNNVESKSAKRQQMRHISETKESLSMTSYIDKQIKTASPSQPTEASQKSVEEGAPSNGEIKEDISKLVRKLTTETGPDEKQLVVITLTGENKGASMVMSSEQIKREEPIFIHRGYKADLDEAVESSTDGETSTKRKKWLNGKPSPESTAYVNNNVQSVNNSIVVETSVTERNPGVHLMFSKTTSEARSGHIEARKSEFTSTRADRLTYEPTVRRRCLRGLMMESSDSEPENPNKPRRHGCKYSRGGKDKEFM